MNAALAAVSLVLSMAWAAPAKTAAPAPISDAAVDWLRVYPLSGYREFWNVSLEVKMLKDALPRVMQAIEKRGGQLTTPLANAAASSSAGSQQLSYRLTAKDAQAALKDLKKIGKVSLPMIRPSGDKLQLSEIKSKLEALNKDKQEHAAELARMPSVAGLVDAVLGHLAAAQALAERGTSEVVMNLTLQERRGGDKSAP